MLDVVLVAAGAVALVVGTFFVGLERWSISPPFLGLLTGILLGPRLLDVLAIPAADRIHVMQVAARLLLAVALMGIALRYPTRAVRARAREVGILVLVALPVMAAVVAVGAAWTVHLPVGIAIVLGACLSPTDPVLASGIVTGEPAEEDIPERGRQALSLESGANDGLAQPLVVLAIAFALDHAIPSELGKAAYEVVGAIAIGIAAGLAAGYALRWAERHRELGPAVRSLYALVLAAFVLGVSGLANVDGLRATWANVLWLGWFGPIGVAALFYLGHAHEQGVTDPQLWAAGTLAIAVSTVIHGLTAGPGRVLLRRHLEGAS